MAVLSPVAKQQFFTDAGAPAAGYLLYTYAANTTTPQATYSNKAGTVANANPIVLDSRGEAIIYLDPTLTYDYVLKTAAGVTVWTREDVLAGGSNSADISFTQSGTGAVARTMQDKARESVSILDFIPPNEHAAIRNGTSTYDCANAWEACQAAFDYDTSTLYSGLPKIRFPGGRYYFSRPIEVRKSVNIEGENSGVSAGWATKLVFAADSHGIVIHWHTSTLTGKESPDDLSTKGGYGTQLNNLLVEGGGGSTGHGIWMRARAYLSNVLVTGFAENGVNVVATSGGSGTGDGNANSFYFQNVTSTLNNRHGFYFDGADVNAGVVIKCSGTNNGGWGFFDSSFLGNTYLGCHASSNGARSQVHYDGNRYYCVSDTLGGSTVPGTDSNVWVLIGAGGAHPVYPDWVEDGDYIIGGAYCTDNANASNVILGCYSEGAQPPSSVIAPTLVLGGLHGAGFTPASNAHIMRPTTSQGRTTSLFVEPSKPNSGYGMSLGEGDHAIRLRAEGDNSSGVSLHKLQNGKWTSLWANTARFMEITTNLSTDTGGRSTTLPSGSLIFPLGFWIGSGNSARLQTVAGSAPSSGEYARGDVIWNRAPSASGKVGWVCTTGGTAGSTAVFKEFGAIDA